MPFTMTMPKLSPTMEEGIIAKWHRKEGDFVEAGAVVLEVTTDKATVEYEAVDEGYLRKILIAEGGSAMINEAIAVFTVEKEESIKGYQPEGVAPQQVAKAAEKVEAAQVKAEPKVAAVAASGSAMIQPAFEPEPPLEQYEFSAPAAVSGRVLASPLARKIAETQRLDLSSVKGSGPGGRIVKRDLERAQPAGPIAFGRHAIPCEMPGTYEEEAMTPMRKAIGRRLQQSKTFIPHFYVTQEVDASALVETRRQLQEYGVKVSYNDLIVRATALTLREKPALNSGFNSVADKIIHFKTIDIAIAVSIEGGLITPIVRHADYKNVGELGIEIKGLAKRAREGKLRPNEYQGGSFTISNLGMYGITDFMAVINPPQSSILAVGGIRECPVVRNGAVVPGHILKLSVACDHRVVDGSQAAEFLTTVKRFLENPAGLLV